MDAELTIPGRRNGPPGMANGGYLAGRVAEVLGADSAEVTLHRPCPLDVALRVRRTDGGCVVEHDGQPVATLRSLAPEAPGDRRFDAAVARAVSGEWRAVNPFPGCFVCGHERLDGDGLFLHPGPVDEHTVVAPWTAPERFAGDGGTLPSHLVWAVLDCPTGYASLLGSPPGPILLGRHRVHVTEPMAAGSEYVIGAWRTAEDGRKRTAEAVLHTPDGRVLAHARSTWIIPRPA